jgi:hypothetical protein
MSYSAVRQFHQEPSLKDVLTTILDNLGVSKQGTVGLVSLLDTDIELITDENDKNLFKFENTEINYDFGEGINKKIKSSCIMIYLNNLLELKKIEIHFFTADLEAITLIKYNSNYEFIDLIYLEENKVFEERIKLLKIAEEKIEAKRLSAYQLIADKIVFTRMEKNKKIIDAITDKLKFITDDTGYFDYVCNNFLLKNVQYEEWKINNHKKFRVVDNFRNNTLSIETNIFNTGIFPVNSSYFVQKCKILFDSDINISSFQFIIKQVKIGNYWIYSFDLDSNLNLTKLSRVDMTGKKMNVDEQHCNGLTFKELIHILKFKLSDNDGIYEIIPEVVVPSAYDFNSEDFKKRLLIAEMLLV